MSTFTAETYQNEYLPAGGSRVDAVVTVTARGAEEAPAIPRAAAEIVIVDTSGSMSSPREKLSAAKEATAAAIDCVRDGVAFAVIGGNHGASQVYPGEGALVPASETTRTNAKRAVGRLRAGGGTAIGAWLALAHQLFVTAPDAIRHAILLTDGQNEHETRDELTRVLAECEGVFQCDCRGVGTDWEVAELRHIASELLGTVDIIPDAAGMQAAFRSMMEGAMGKRTPDVSLRLWTPQDSEVASVKQVSPAIEDLRDRATAVDTQTADYPTAAWGDESRDYHLCIDVKPRAIGDEMLAGRLTLVVDDEPATQALIKAIWTDDEQLSTRIDRKVAGYTGQEELADAVGKGLDARKAGDEATATLQLGRAVQLANESGNDAMMERLERVVDVDDATAGTVRLKETVEEVDEMVLDTRSTQTVRIQ